MEFEICRVQNGVVLRVESDGEDSGEEIVCQEQEDDEIEAFADFLRHIVDHCGPHHHQSLFAEKDLHPG